MALPQRESTGIIGPLNLNPTVISYKIFEDKEDVVCLFCDSIYEFPISKDDYLAHLYLIHKLIVADVGQIANLKEYLKYWRNYFTEHNVEEYCTTMLMDQLPDGTPALKEKYYLLSDILPQDFEIRQKLHTKRLENVLEQHKFERTDQNFERICLFCNDVVKPCRTSFLDHLYTKHFLLLGKSDNLVFIDELIDTVQLKMEKLICLFCEKIFKDRRTLKEHMRKKGHKRINPENKEYDKFFLINYKQDKASVYPKRINNKPYDKNERTKQLSCVFQTDDSDSDWSDWQGEKQVLTCLYCPHNENDFTLITNHLKEKHNFDFEETIGSLTFYQKVKIVNYIRRQMHTLHCPTCNQKFEMAEMLTEHLNEANHFSIGERKFWDQPEFFFSTYEDDGFLCYLEDSNDTNIIDDSSVVVSEDATVTINKDAELLSMEKFNLVN